MMTLDLPARVSGDSLCWLVVIAGRLFLLFFRGAMWLSLRGTG